MIQKLRIKLIAVSMAALIMVLVAIMGAVNFYNYCYILEDADETLTILAENDGKFPHKDDKQGQKHENGGQRNSPELPYESRFFFVQFGPSGEILLCDTDHIAAVDGSGAVQLALNALSSGKEQGFLGNYRYLTKTSGNGVWVFFLDCTRSLNTFRNFLMACCVISLIGVAAVFVLIVLLSGRIVRPVSESYEKQKRFITDAGHEIKTPITIIDADAEVLEMEMEDNEWLQDIRKQAKRLGNLTNNLIYLSRMEEEQLPLQAIAFPVSDLVEETAQSFQALAKTQNKTFRADVEPMLSFRGDEKEIQQLVTILLDNALKYSPEGGEIDLQLQKKGKLLCLQVSNTTNDLDKQDLNCMFERFYRGDKARNSQSGGFGIGLSIAQAITNAHKGKISAVSQDGKRLTITVSFPC